MRSQDGEGAVAPVHAGLGAVGVDQPDQSGTGRQPVPYFRQDLAGPVTGRDNFGHQVGGELRVALVRNQTQVLA